MKRFTILLGLAVLLLAPVILADVPKLINFQGILRDGSGNPVPDAVYVIRFRIYDDSTAGSNLWEEFDDVQTTDGLFNVRLGDTTNLPNGLFEGSVNRFVGVKVGGDPETAPRTRLISVPFAFHALKSDSAATATVALDLTCASCVDAGDIDATQVQRRVIGTAPPNEYITGINQDGSVVTAVDQVGAASGWTDDGAVVRLSTGTDNVGIGTTSPQFGARLEVVDRVNVIGAGTSRLFIAKDADEYLEASYNAGFSRGQLSTFNSSQPLILQQTGGNVGIGTISPGSRLQVEGQISSSVTGAAAPGFTFTGDLNTGLFETIPDELGLATNGVDRLHITSGGSVGIGTTSPTKKLEVAGSIKVGTNDTVFSSNISSNSPLSLQAPTGTTRMHIDDVTGNVGIGTASPTTALEVAGQISASSALPTAPAYSFAGDLNTGIYGFSDFLFFSTGGTQQGYITPSGQFVMQSRAQIGTTTAFGDPSTLYVQGSIATAITTVVGPTTLTSSNSVVLVNTAATTITLPGAVFVPGRQYTIKKISAAAGIVTVDGNGAETIDGAATHSLTVQYEYVTIVSNGTSWFVVADN